MTDPTDTAAEGAFHRLPSDRTAPRRAREWVRGRLRASPASLESDTEMDVLLCTSELVNAALLASAQRMTLGMRADAECVRVTLEADTPVPKGRDPVTLAQLQCFKIVQRAADRWALEATAAGRLCWAEFDCGGDHLLVH